MIALGCLVVFMYKLQSNQVILEDRYAQNRWRLIVENTSFSLYAQREERAVEAYDSSWSQSTFTRQIRGDSRLQVL